MTNSFRENLCGDFHRSNSIQIGLARRRRKRVPNLPQFENIFFQVKSESTRSQTREPSRQGKIKADPGEEQMYGSSQKRKGQCGCLSSLRNNTEQVNDWLFLTSNTKMVTLSIRGGKLENAIIGMSLTYLFLIQHCNQVSKTKTIIIPLSHS